MPRRTGLKRVHRSPSLGSYTSENSAKHKDRAPPSDYEYFELSDSPDEDFGDDDQKEWPVKAIVGEEILQNRHIRYQVEWEGWQRADGTNTTWTIGLLGASNLLDDWDADRAKEKLDKASAKCDIDLAQLHKYMPHQFRTFECAAAYEEKRRKWRKMPDLWKEWLEMDKNSDEEDTERARVKEEPRASVFSEDSRKRKRTESVAPSTRASASTSRLPDEETTRVSSSVPGGSARPGPSTSRSQHSQIQSQSLSQPLPRPAPRPQTQPSSCLQLQRKWNQVMREAGAARLTIVNEVDDEECPVLPPDFVYLENRCTYAAGVKDPKTDENKAFMLCCECEDGCVDPMSCDCLDQSQCVDEDGDLTVAYDNEGRFLFHDMREIVECNENCACRADCANAVAQKPRTIPIEVFKTKRNGWGARSPVRIPKGTVLGFYTGKIMEREQLSRLPADKREYSFDLDIRDDDEGLPHYSVCAYNEGNWTRFVNHSCNPNCIVYSMVFDAPVHLNMPYIVLAAKEVILPNREITIDYNPTAGRERQDGGGRKKKGRGKRKGKGKVKVEEMDDDVDMLDSGGRTKCVCGSSICRGYI